MSLYIQLKASSLLTIPRKRVTKCPAPSKTNAKVPLLKPSVKINNKPVLSAKIVNKPVLSVIPAPIIDKP